jgi:hypothetical protein
MFNPTSHISDIMDADADAREELNAAIDADNARIDDPTGPVSDHFRDYDSEDLPVEFDDDDGFDLTGDEDFDPSGGMTENDFPQVGDDYDYDEDGHLEAEAEAYHSQWD